MKVIRILLLSALLLPTTALAGDPLSPFVRELINRADQGMAHADSYSTVANCDEYGVQDNARKSAEEYIRKFIDTETLLTRQTESLRAMTVCQRYDLWILEEKMRELLEKTATLANSCNVNGIRTIGDVYSFIAGGYKSVVQGGLDPASIDFRMRTKQFWSGDEEFPFAPACPFTTDYAPASLVDENGSASEYGCDEWKISEIEAQSDIPDALRFEAEQEREKKIAATEVAQSLSDQIYNFDIVFSVFLGIIRGKPPDLPPPRSDMSLGGHQVIEGCRSNTDETFTVEVWDHDDLPKGLIVTPTYEPFSFYKDAFVLMRDFARANARKGFNRTLPDFIKTDASTYFPFWSQVDLLDQWRGITSEQERRRGNVTAATTDTIDKMIDASKPLHQAVLKFGYVSSFPDPKSKNDLPFFPMYIRDVAYFLRRSCVFGPCQQMLDNVLRRTLDPSCFPYGLQKDTYCARIRCYDLDDPECPSDQWNP